MLSTIDRFYQPSKEEGPIPRTVLLEALIEGVSVAEVAFAEIQAATMPSNTIPSNISKTTQETLAPFTEMDY